MLSLRWSVTSTTGTTSCWMPAWGRRASGVPTRTAPGRSDPDLRRDPARRDGVDQGRVVPLVLVGVRLGELPDGDVEGPAVPEVGSQRHAVPGPGVRAGERPPADGAVRLQALGEQRLDLDGALPVAQLADVEVPVPAVDPDRVDPAEEDVADGLHQPLSDHDALPAVAVLARADELLEHRGPGLLRLQEERAAVVLEHQDHPRARAHAADTDDLPGDVHQVVAVQQPAA